MGLFWVEYTLTVSRLAAWCKAAAAEVKTSATSPQCSRRSSNPILQSSKPRAEVSSRYREILKPRAGGTFNLPASVCLSWNLSAPAINSPSRAVLLYTRWLRVPLFGYLFNVSCVQLTKAYARSCLRSKANPLPLRWVSACNAEEVALCKESLYLRDAHSGR